jgi:NAD(P)-dependent dehydrogenase (short-subunit alcohol dehydrogenase family)
MGSFPIHGKVAIVTGAQKGIGFATARELQRRGAYVALVDLDLEAVERSATEIGARTLAIEADVTDLEAMEGVVARVNEELGPVAIVVANAGIAPPTEPMHVIDNDTFERVVEVDLMGVWRTVRPALPQVIAQQGHIVVVASIYAFMNGVLATPYAMAKAGVEALGRSLRVELAPHGASAGVAYFGFIDTDMVRQAFADPIAREVEKAFPSFVTNRLTPDIAGTAIADGILKREPRTIRPRWWAAWSTLRGIVNPLFDRLSTRDEHIASALAEGEQRAAAPPQPDEAVKAGAE